MSDATATPAQVPVRVLGGPTALIEYGGLRFLTDPTFDAPGEYPLGGGRSLTKTAPSAADPADLGPVDAVLLSHDQHPDNLDTAGRALLAELPVVLTTRSAAARLGGTTRGLAPWDAVDLPRPGGGTVTVTATPALHGPEGCEPITGEVVGFVLTAAGLPTVHVSGDNASLDVVREIAGRVGPVDTAVLFAGAARTALFDGALLTIDGARAAEAARVLGARRVVAAHCDSWAHFTEGREDVVAAFTAAGIADRLQLD
ncbi:MBL fold metallo-hydrolase [Geodermatophilus obscurus]|uniref:Zn-dependent hydrolase of the beta-lactamase fold-like protein n=1 Tax=Geodermatophilus obscurus (strain ATCC 25078 / DSM 43160 / JCM 3152 / CCUG 61914 / KCC A-0152 / KCTC 9177 / NBRC 13315 / NRRL B-3577 / G-20) TaxID=526225 RepID=D2S6N8_GEOOG|nr:MBL fold metallo-hydrolase [Geodermatophilus obscurus]ADB75412.1 Zn-dependent hydrolase of the beta-lactamase fold-like protein [Geodermatophilus obscurus DSM 43160]